jgi:hypothetical protein
MRAYMAWPLSANGGAVRAVHSVDIATHPDFRGQGLNLELSKRAIEQLRETTSFSLGLPNQMSRSLSHKVGWQPVARLPLWVRVCRPLRVLGRPRSLRSAAGAASGAPVEAAPAAHVLSDAASVAELLDDSPASPSQLNTAADAGYLRWRYEPMLADYRAVTEHDGGRLSGLAIFAVRRRGELSEAGVCELIVRTGDKRTAARLVRQIVRAAPVDYLAAVPAGGSGQAALLRRAGFVPSPAGGRPLGVTIYREGTEPDPRARRSWSLSFGDVERLQLC